MVDSLSLWSVWVGVIHANMLVVVHRRSGRHRWCPLDARWLVGGDGVCAGDGRRANSLDYRSPDQWSPIVPSFDRPFPCRTLGGGERDLRDEHAPASTVSRAGSSALSSRLGTDRSLPDRQAPFH